LGEAGEERLFEDFLGLEYGLVVVLRGAIDDDLEAGAIEADGIYGVETTFEHAESEGAGFGDQQQGVGRGQDAGPFGRVDQAEVRDDEVEGAAGEFEDAQQGFERDGLALLGAQSYVQGAGENVYA
jgi:hypothetical protein